MDYDYSGKTAVEALQGICMARRYPPPVFMDRSPPAGSTIIVTTVVGGRAYGSGEGETSALACDQASQETLSMWLKESFQPHLLKPLRELSSIGVTVDNQDNGEALAGGEGPQLNALSIFNLYVSAVVRDVASKPVFECKKIAEGPPPKFHCVLTITIDSKVYKSEGEGGTKVAAKRAASYDVLKHMYPQCPTLEQLNAAVDRDIAARRRNKKGNKASASSSAPPAAPVVALQQAVDVRNTLPVRVATASQKRSVASTAPVSATDELSLAVANVAKDIKQVGIQIADGYHLRQATVDDIGTILKLVAELAEYEQCADSVKMDRDTLAKDGWGVGTSSSDFRPYFYVYLIDKVGVETVGLALFFPVYSTWEGKFLYLEDLYVKEAHRAQGLGSVLMRAVGAVAVKMDIPRYQWQCLAWNEKPLEFYARTGARSMDEWRTLRLEGADSIHRFVREGIYPREEGEERGGGGKGEVKVASEPERGSRSSWGSCFASAREMAVESDLLVADFVYANSGRGQQSKGEDEDSVGGFCQPKDLSLFVNCSLQQRAAEGKSDKDDAGGNCDEEGDGSNASDSTEGSTRCKRSIDSMEEDEEEGGKDELEESSVVVKIEEEGGGGSGGKKAPKMTSSMKGGKRNRSK